MSNGNRIHNQGGVSVRADNSLDRYRDSRNFESTLHQIRAWLDDDPPTGEPPTSRGYASKSDAEVEADMLVDTTPILRDTVRGDELLENTDSDELEELRNGVHGLEAPTYTDPKPGNWGDAVNDATKQEKDYRDWVNLICLDTREFAREGAIVKDLRMKWGTSSQTFANLLDYYNNTLVVDRGTWLIGRVITELDIANARAL